MKWFIASCIALTVAAASAASQEFDFARAENKTANSPEMIRRLAEVYLNKARRNGGSPVAVRAIERFFKDTIAKLPSPM